MADDRTSIAPATRGLRPRCAFLPLTGVRVADFSFMLAAPTATMLLSTLGAEVIRIESKRRVDFLRRRYPPNFNDLNLNKLSATLDLTQPQAVALAKRIVAVSDVVVDSFRPRVMPKLGLSYADLRKVRPDVIYCALSGFGGAGPEANFATYAAIFSAMGGLAHITGWPDGIPTELRGTIDLTTAMGVAFAILPALVHRKRTGQGQHIDLSARELFTCHMGETVLDYTMNGREQGRTGNADPVMAPHGVYPCKGEPPAWVSVAVATDEEFRALSQALGQPALADDPRFRNGPDRWKNQEALDAIIADWTKDCTDYEVTETLQKVGVAAFPVMSGKEVWEDPHLRERRLYTQVEHAELGRRWVVRPPWRFNLTPPETRRAAPLMGEHNAYVFGEVLGMEEGDIKRLEAERAIY
ncbi:MAG: CoA transferase [Chloroflexi bacterium]|nr:CoA transferase [Chloroflexota bacterium]